MILCDKRNTNRIIALFLLLTIQGLTYEVESEELVKGSIAYYFDDRDFNTTTIHLASNRKILGFSFWGFTDWHRDQKEDGRVDMTRSFSEYRLTNDFLASLTNLPGMAAQIELNIVTPGDRDVSRAGLTYKHSFRTISWKENTNHGWLQWRVFPLESDGNGGQLSLIYKIPFTSKISLGGFADYNIVEKGENRWVVEPQLFIGLIDRVSALIEFRYNEYEGANPTLDGFGTAIGIQIEL